MHNFVSTGNPLQYIVSTFECKPILEILWYIPNYKCNKNNQKQIMSLETIIIIIIIIINLISIQLNLDILQPYDCYRR